MSTHPLKLGQLSYLLGLPFYTAIQEEMVPFSGQLVPGVPAELNQALAAGEIDVSLVSSYHYLTNRDKYDPLLPFCVAAEQEVMSVLLYVRDGDLNKLDGQPLALTPQSASSAQLVKLLCHNFWQIEPQFVPLPSLEQATAFPAFLLIGDQALFNPTFEGYQTIDLAEAWYDKTLLPMTFAVFALRKEVANRETDLDQLTDDLERSLAWAEQNPDVIQARFVAQSGLSPERTAAYLKLIRYRLTDREWDGLRAFASLSNLKAPDPLPELIEA